MNKDIISRDYANDMIFELEKAFWDERGKGARFRLTTLGRDFFRTKCLPKIQSTEMDDMVAVIEGVLKENGIIDGMSLAIDGRLLRVRIAGCTHRPVEDRMMAHETKPFACLPANMIVLAVDEKLNRPAELAEIKLVDGACEVLIVLFEKKPC
ncbi:MAG: hypothetical protein NTW71_02180 [Deltaproteobacteria bacterium]|nr:hypothetical protein [Deltaproteobacteria bacterium]MCX5837315.1 hypothetical protein [Deltaproteobacteria bacterium]